MAASILIAFGFGWMVAGAFLGLYLGAKHPAHLDQLGAAAAEGNLAAYHRVFEAYKWRSSVHAHSMLFSLSSVAVGSLLSRNEFASVSAEALAATLIFATIVWSFSALARIRALMGLSDLLFVASMAWVAVIVAKNLWPGDVPLL